MKPYCLALSEIERDLLMCALDNWRSEIADDKSVFSTGQRYACRFTVRRIDELRKRLHALIADVEPTK